MIRSATARALGQVGAEDPEVEVEVVEDSEEEALCREIMEEPEDEIRVNVKYRLPVPVEYVTVRLDMKDDDGV